MEHPKIAIVCSKGGMQCAYSAGALVALGREYGFNSPDIIIGSSGSAANILYYLTGQYQEMEYIWTKLLSTPRFISFIRLKEIMRIDYLIDTVLKRQRPLDTKRLAEVKTRYFIPVTETSTGVVRYFTNADSVDVFEVLRAAKALPIASNKKVLIQNKTYFDGGVVHTLGDEVKKAINEGANTVVVISNDTPYSIYMMFLPRIYAFMFMSLEIRKKFFDKFRSWGNIPYGIEGVNIFYVSRPFLPGGILTRNKKRLEEIFKLGYEDVLDNKELKTFFANYQNDRNKIISAKS